MTDVGRVGGDGWGSPGGRRRGLTVAAVAVAAAVAAVVVTTAGAMASGAGFRSASPPAPSDSAPTTATVQRTNLAETTPVNGTVGFAGPLAGGPNPLSIVQPAGTAPSVLDQDQQAVAAARQTLAADRQAAAGPNPADTHSVAQAKVAADQLTLAKALSAAAEAQASETAYDQTSRYTALPAVGQVIQPGQVLWSIDGHPVALVPGTLIPWRAFTAGMTPGPDVATLDQALIALGYGAGLAVSTDVTQATVGAIDRLEAALGDPQTGSLPLGSVIFEPAAVRVTTVHPLLGAPVSPGAAVLDVTSTTPIVNVALPVEQSYLVKVGDPVSVNLPDGTTAPGTITAVGTVAAATTTPSSGSSSAASPAASSSEPSATVDVTVTVAHASGAATLDQAPVTVEITNATADDTLAVDITALLPLAGGGYAVEVVNPDGTHRLVAVTTGIFDDQAGMVQVSGVGLAAGQKVVAAA